MYVCMCVCVCVYIYIYASVSRSLLLINRSILTRVYPQNQRLLHKEAQLVEREGQLATAQELIEMLKHSKASVQASLQVSFDTY